MFVVDNVVFSKEEVFELCRIELRRRNRGVSITKQALLEKAKNGPGIWVRCMNEGYKNPLSEKAKNLGCFEEFKTICERHHVKSRFAELRGVYLELKPLHEIGKTTSQKYANLTQAFRRKSVAILKEEYISDKEKQSIAEMKEYLSVT